MSGRAAARDSRSSSLELMRILLMLLIVLHHSVVNSGVMDSWDIWPGSPSAPILLFAGMWGKACINPFVMVTGYFMCRSGVTAARAVRLLGQISFWFLVVNVLLLVLGLETPFEALKAMLTPVRDVDANFISSYLVMYACIPLLNLWIARTGRGGVLSALAVILWTQSLLPTFLVAPSSYSEVVWYIGLYLMGALVRLWPTRWMSSLRTSAVLFAGSVLLAVASVALLYPVGMALGAGWQKVYLLVGESGRMLALAAGFSCFLLFKNLRMPRSVTVNRVAATTFGVLLVHANCPAMREWLWADLLDVPSLWWEPDQLVVALRLGLGAVGVFVACSALDALRGMLFGTPLFRYLGHAAEEALRRMASRARGFLGDVLGR